MVRQFSVEFLSKDPGECDIAYRAYAARVPRFVPRLSADRPSKGSRVSAEIRKPLELNL